MTGKPKPFLISEDSILEYCDPSSWSRGQNYFKSKMIYDATLIDNVLYAKCEGGKSEDYNIQVMLSSGDQEKFETNFQDLAPLVNEY